MVNCPQPVWMVCGQVPVPMRWHHKPVRISSPSGQPRSGISKHSQALAVQQGLAGAGVTAQITLLTAGEALGWDLPPKLQHRLKTVLTNRGVRVREDTCIQIEAETLTLGRGTPLACDLALIPTGIESHPAVYRSALQHDTQGRVLINNRLQSLSHPQVFAVGALSHWEPRGNRPPVAHHSDEWGSTLGLNLMAYLSEQPLSVASFETTGPMVVDCGDQTALMQWGPLCAESHWTWKIRTQRLHAMLTS
jgi:NADH dehydrogenase FAD-containing subunit